MDIRQYGDRTALKLHCDDPSRTKQSFLEETLITNILSKYRQSGVITHTNPNAPTYADFISTQDYKSSLDKIHDVTEEFKSLSADTRAKYENDPLSFLEAVENDDFEPVPITITPETPAEPELPLTAPAQPETAETIP